MKDITDDIERVLILCARGGEYQEWEVWAQREADNDHTREPMRMLSGEPVTWITAESALRWVLSQPYTGRIEVIQAEQSMHYI